MSRTTLFLILMAVCSTASGQQFSSAIVSGGGFSTAIDLINDPPFIQSFVNASTQVDIDLLPVSNTTQNATVRLAQFNGTGVSWPGLDLELSGGASFTALPMPTLGEMFEVSIHGQANEKARILFPVSNFEILQFDIKVAFEGPFGVQITQAPEPGLGFVVISALMGLSMRTARSGRTKVRRCCGAGMSGRRA
ncbi:MAG: hypothetical protein AAF916_01520 [Planctomycetota bacterium]